MVKNLRNRQPIIRLKISQWLMLDTIYCKIHVLFILKSLLRELVLTRKVRKPISNVITS